MAYQSDIYEESELCLLETDARGIAHITLNRPLLFNALNDELIQAVTSSILALDKDPAIRAITVKGAGQHFSAGVDISWMEHMSGYGPSDDARRLATLLYAIKTLSIPTLALVEGTCFGGGVALAACCDIAISTDTAFFALPAIRLGAAPAVVGPFVVAAIGERQARRYLLTGERFDAATAQSIGLAHIVTSSDELQSTAENILENLLRGGPKALADTKEIISASLEMPLSKSNLEKAAIKTGNIRRSDEAREGLAAFLEKRKPDWSQ